jgi:hypothetical protein
MGVGILVTGGIVKGGTMLLKDLSGKTIYDLESEEIDALFCSKCKERPRCDQDFKTMDICKQLIDGGIWDSLYRKRLQG